MSDVRELMNLENWFGDPGHTGIRSHVMITETRLASCRQVGGSRIEVDEENQS